jgi:hypothetical protein
LHEKYEFSLDLLAFVSNCHQTKARHFYSDFKNIFLKKMQNFLSFGRIFFQTLQTSHFGTWQQRKYETLYDGLAGYEH